MNEIISSVILIAIFFLSGIVILFFLSENEFGDHNESMSFSDYVLLFIVLLVFVFIAEMSGCLPIESELMPWEN